MNSIQKDERIQHASCSALKNESSQIGKKSHNMWILYKINFFGRHWENISKNANATKLFVVEVYFATSS